MRCGGCNKKLSRVKRWYFKWMTKRTIYVVQVVTDEGEEVERFPVCGRCGHLWYYLAEIHEKYGLKGTVTVLDKLMDDDKDK